MFKNRASYGKELAQPRVFEKFGLQYDIDIDELLNYPLEEFGDEQEKEKEKEKPIQEKETVKPEPEGEH